jgi:hypothetical protein
VIQNLHAVSLVLHFPHCDRIQGSGFRANRSAKCRLVRADHGIAELVERGRITLFPT